MIKAYHWLVCYNLKGRDPEIPHVKAFGGNQINSSLYYHDPSVRTDTPHYIFQYTLSGKGIFRYKGVEYELTAGKAFFCNSHDENMSYFYPPNETQTYEILYCCLCGDLNLFESIAERYGRVFELSSDDKALKQFLDYRIKSHDIKYIDMNLSECFMKSSILLNSLIKSKEEIIEKNSTSFVDKVIIYIRENIEEKLSIAQLADIFEISASHLSREFKKQTGLNPQKFIDTIRMKHAAKLISSSLLSVKETAYRLHFDNPAHFVRSFKRVHGVTPGSFKRR